MKLPKFLPSLPPGFSIYTYMNYYQRLIFLKFPRNYLNFSFFPPLDLVSISITIIIDHWNLWNFLEITQISTFFPSLGLVCIHILLLSMTDISEISEISLKLPKFLLSSTPRSSVCIYHYYYQLLKFPKFPWNYQNFYIF